MTDYPERRRVRTLNARHPRVSISIFLQKKNFHFFFKYEIQPKRSSKFGSLNLDFA